jgi:hypothetical protein
VQEAAGRPHRLLGDEGGDQRRELADVVAAKVADQLSDGSAPEERRLDQKRSTPSTAPAAATTAAAFGARDPSRVPGTADFAFERSARRTNGLAAE